MPYGLPKDIGGDSPSNTKWMESCVRKVSKEGSKGSAITICKSQLIKSRRKGSKAEFSELDSEVKAEFLSKRYSFIKNKMSNGFNYKQANDLFEKKIIKDNYLF